MNLFHLSVMYPLKNVTPLPWTALRAFEAAARHNSFKAAAQELGLTPTAISHQIKRLETHLGVSLFERLHRMLKLTPTGRIFARDVMKLFLGLDASLDRLKRAGRVKDTQMLTVSVVPSLAAKWLAPRLHEFHKARPEIGLRIAADETLVDFRRDRSVDIALRYGPGVTGKSLHAERLWPKVEIIAVCRPDIAKMVSSDRGLTRQLLLRTASPRSARVPDWPDWCKAAGIKMTGERDGPVFNTTQLAVEAAVAGRGIALAPGILVAADIASGRLAQLNATKLADPNSFWLLCRADRAKDSRIQAFIRWIRREARA